MAILAIPEFIKVGLLGITSLTDEQFQELCSVLENLPLRIKQGTIFDYTELEIRSIPPNDVGSIQDALFPIYIAQGTTDRAASTYISDIIETLQEDEETSEDAIARLKERLTRLLELERPKLIAKANDVLTGQKPTYLSGRVFTDIRSVFTDDIEQSPQAAVVVQVLRLSYYKDRTPREFTIALDGKDVQQLIDILERAKKKAETLRSVIASANMNFIDIV
jgi:hypothetical protein